MALYQDKKTGVIISTECEVSGDWELVVEKKKAKAKEE
jgi:hypothetical protein|nr:MAG TPA: hypothetical protein [Caudoviricetes sp.]DAU46397.1 MAG TPA: hypothetical protein [Caudoviricetes sp.]DAV60952.1 MAG TPA: hypothetical protein [Caudoviricetes sp.]